MPLEFPQEFTRIRKRFEPGVGNLSESEAAFLYGEPSGDFMQVMTRSLGKHGRSKRCGSSRCLVGYIPATHKSEVSIQLSFYGLRQARCLITVKQSSKVNTLKSNAAQDW